MGTAHHYLASQYCDGGQCPPYGLRVAIRIVNETLNMLRVEKHPDKTFIGRVERGFNFLGYFLKPGHLSASRETFERFADRISLLYEQGAEVGPVC